MVRPLICLFSPSSAVPSLLHLPSPLSLPLFQHFWTYGRAHLHVPILSLLPIIAALDLWFGTYLTLSETSFSRSSHSSISLSCSSTSFRPMVRHLFCSRIQVSHISSLSVTSPSSPLVPSDPWSGTRCFVFCPLAKFRISDCTVGVLVVNLLTKFL